MKFSEYERWRDMDAVSALMDYAGAREVVVKDTYYAQELVDESGRVLWRKDATTGETWVIPKTPILHDFADRGLQEQ